MFILYVAFAWGLGLLMVFVPFPVKVFLFVLCSVLFTYVFRNYGKQVWIALVFLIVAIAWAYMDDVKHRSPILEITHIMKDERVSMIVKGKIDSFPVVDGDRLRFFLQVEELFQNDVPWKIKERIWVSIRLVTQEEQQKAKLFSRGDRIALPVDLSLPRLPTNPGEFNFSHYLWQQYTYLQGYGEGLSSISMIQPANELGWKGVHNIRSFLEGRIDEVFSPEIAGLMKAMLLGVQEDLSADLEDIYRNTGIVHIVAISGSHVMLVIVSIYVLLHGFHITRERVYEILFVFLPFYMLLTGLSPSVVRASLMGMIYVLANRFYRPYSAIHAISIVFVFVTLISPRILYSIGFQLSFAITLSLVLFTQPVSEWLQKRLKITPAISMALAVTIVAQLFSLPFIAYHFHVLPLSSIIVNALILPLFTLIIPWGYLCMLIAILFPQVAKWIALPLDGGMQVLHNLLKWIAELPYNLISFSILPTWWYVYYILVIILCLIPMGAKIKRIKRLFLILFCILMLAPWIQQYFDSSVKITILNVGQGDSIVIQGPKKFTMVIDGGGQNFTYPKENWQMRRDPFDVGDDVVVPALRSLGITSIDWLVLTHGDGDHIGGVKEIVKQLPIKHVLYNGKQPNTVMEKELMQLIQERKIPIYSAKVSPWLGWSDQVTWEIVHPNVEDVAYLNDNEASVVLLLYAYGRTALFTGDLGEEGERKIASLLPESIDLLKVGHHGSRGSTTDVLLQKIRPKYAVISVGKNNRYGHPHQEVLQRLNDYQTIVFRTDLQGAITYQITRNGEIRWKSWKVDVVR